MRTLSWNEQFIRSVRAETLKLKRSAVWAAVVALPVVAVFLGAGNYTVNAAAMSGNAWHDFWTQIALFYGYFFYPVLIATLAAYLFRLEHTEHNWNSVMTSGISPSVVWASKFFILYVFAFVCQAAIIALYVFTGKIVLHLSGWPGPVWIYWIVMGPLSVMACGSMQLCISERVRSFALPVGLSFGLCVVGLVCYAKGVWFFPNTLAIIGINAQHDSLPTAVEIAKVLAASFAWQGLFSWLGVRYLKKTDVRSEV